MCGICGIFNLDNKPIDVENLYKMTNKIRHRGPDDEGYLLINSKQNKIRHAHHQDTITEVKTKTENLFSPFTANIGFGYRRLSILDLSAKGHQPMSYQKQFVWIIFNGEIYNYLELREDLKSLGYAFVSECDTEVILAAYCEWSFDCLNKFNGMFAFSIWDNNKKILFNARDRLGIKPFYYQYNQNVFNWASEIKQILEINYNTEANYRNIHDFIFYSHQNMDNSTFFKQIHELPAGHYCVVSSSGMEISRYWTLKSKETHVPTVDSYKETFSNLLSDSVQLRLRSDVPLGIALSGGLDSSSISCLASRKSTNTINTFSVFYTDRPEFDERIYIEEVLKSGNFNPVYFTSDGTFNMDAIENWIYYQDEPCISASPFSAFNNYRNIKENGITVALNGQGGDEILAGYAFFFKYYYMSLLQSKMISTFINDLKKFNTLYKKSYLESIKFLLQVVLRYTISEKFLESNLRKENISFDIYSDFIKSQKKKIIFEKPFENYLDNKLYETIRYTIIPRLLHWEDRNSMAYSVESRVPFLDHRLVEFMFTVPIDQKIKNGLSKVILRDAMKEIIPEKVRSRTDKIGFGTPTDIWTNSVLKNDILDIFNSKKFTERGILNTSKLIQDFNRGKTFKKNEIWKLLTLELWFRQFIDQ